MSLENQNRQMSCPLWMLLLLLIGAALLYVLHNHASTKKAQYIQQDIENRTITNLSDDDRYPSISVSADGRDITLSGTVRNEDDKTNAGLIASETNGVRQVSNLITIEQAQVSAPVPDEPKKAAEIMTKAKLEPLPDEFLPLPEENSEPEAQNITAAVEQFKKLDFSNITFERNSSDLTNQAIDTLDVAAKTLLAHPEVQIRIEGHTDSSGSPEVNLTISEQRAKSVLDHLVAAGIDSTRMEAEGFGDQHPIAPNETAEGRITNRRIEIKVINGE